MTVKEKMICTQGSYSMLQLFLAISLSNCLFHSGWAAAYSSTLCTEKKNNLLLDWLQSSVAHTTIPEREERLTQLSISAIPFPLWANP